MVFEHSFNTVCEVIINPILFELFLSQSYKWLHKLKPDKSTFRVKWISFPVCSWHRVGGYESKICDFERSVLADYLCLLTKLSKWLVWDSPNIAKGIPRGKLFVNGLNVCIVAPEKSPNLVLINLVFDEIHDLRLLPIPFKTFSEELFIIKFPLLSPHWLAIAPRLLHLFRHQPIESRKGLHGDLIQIVGYPFGLACSIVHLVHMIFSLNFIDNEGKIFINCEILGLSMCFEDDFIVMRKEVSIFFGRNHGDVPNIVLVVRDKSGFVWLEVKVHINVKFSLRFRQLKSKLLLVPSLTDPAHIF